MQHTILALHGFALSGVPEPAKTELRIQWRDHDAELAAEGISESRRLWEAVRAVGSHTTSAMRHDPLHVPALLSTVSQVGGLFVLCWLMQLAGLAGWSGVLPLFVGGSVIAITVLNPPLRARRRLVAFSDAIAVSGLLVTLFALEVRGFASLLVFIGVANFGVVNTLGVVEWVRVQGGRQVPPTLRFALWVSLLSSANLAVGGLVLLHARDGRIIVASLCALVSVVAAFGTYNLWRLREQYGSIFGPPKRAESQRPHQSDTTVPTGAAGHEALGATTADRQS